MRSPRGFSCRYLSGGSSATSLVRSKLFSAKYRFALFPERLHALLRIRGSGCCGEGLRLVLHLVFQRTVRGLQKQPLDATEGLGRSRCQAARDPFCFLPRRIVAATIVTG